MKMYAIRNNKTGYLMAVSATGTGDSMDCNSYEAELQEFYPTDQLWLTSNRATAEKVLSGKVQWYNSDLEQPQLNRDCYKDVSIVELEIEIKL